VQTCPCRQLNCGLSSGLCMCMLLLWFVVESSGEHGVCTVRGLCVQREKPADSDIMPISRTLSVPDC
jgi:hypothetical protein